MANRDELRNRLTDLRDAALDANSAARNAIWEYVDFAIDLIDAVPETPEPAPEPIKDARAYVASRSRYGISHAVTVKDGKLRCTCEAATYHPENGPCYHAVLATSDGLVDFRAEWDGGLHGLPSPTFDLSKIDELLIS